MGIKAPLLAGIVPMSPFEKLKGGTSSFINSCLCRSKFEAQLRLRSRLLCDSWHALAHLSPDGASDASGFAKYYIF
jgi:hypothetical protein